LNVTLRVQRIREKQEVFNVTKTPGPELEKAVVEVVGIALKGTNQVQPVD
jgi:hypothetical protein